MLLKQDNKVAFIFHFSWVSFEFDRDVEKLMPPLLTMTEIRQGTYQN